MLLNSFCQMAQVIVYVFITEAKQCAARQNNQCYLSLYISIYHYINNVFDM